MCDPAPLTAARSALNTLTLATFTGVLVLTWVGGTCRRVHWEGVGVGWPAVPPNWSHAHSTALAAIRGWAADLGDGYIVVQLRAGVPVGTYLDNLP